jgi:hypothetical protein
MIDPGVQKLIDDAVSGFRDQLTAQLEVQRDPFKQQVQATIEAQLQRKIHEQPWFKKSSNTVTTAFTGLVTLAWWLTGTGLDLPSPVVNTIAGVLFLAQVLGVKATRNGTTSTTVRDATAPDVMEAIISEVKVHVAEGKHAVPADPAGTVR